jgi:hypothetical protein
MLVLGHAVVLLLVAIAAVSASSLARWARVESGAEHLLATMLGGAALLLLGIHGLGVAGALWPTTLFAAVAVLAVVIVALTRDGETLAGRWPSSARALGQSVARVVPLARELREAGPLVVMAAAVLVAAIAWATLLTYLCPSDSWDGVWYHDLMVGYAIQQHGYAPIELPSLGIAPLFQQANGYPRNSEMLSLFFAIYTGRTWLELPSVIAAIPLALTTYLFVLRVSPSSRVAALVWAAAIVVLPGVRLQMRSTYVDNAFAAFNLAAFYFASDPKLCRRRAVVAALCFGLALGTKGMALLSVPPLALLAVLVLVVRSGRRELGKTLGAIAFAGLLVVAVGGVSYLMSYLRYDNPFWPVTVKVGGLNFPGAVSTGTVMVSEKGDVIANLFAVPVPGRDYVDTRASGYGIATGVLLLPLAALGALTTLWRSGLALVAKARERRALTDEERGTLLLAAVGAIAAFTLWKSPALWGARYNLHGIAMLMVFAAAAGALTPKAELSRVGAAAAVLVANVLMWFWAEPGWGVKWGEAVARLRSTALEREAESPLFVKRTVLARDSELGRGDLVVWSGNLDFASALHNHSYSNRLKYVGQAPVDHAEAEGARWLALPAASGEAALARSRGDRWQSVGMLHNHPQMPTMVFRSLSRR